MPKGTAGAFYDIQVEPGNKLVRRKVGSDGDRDAHRIPGAAGEAVRAL